MTLSSGHRPFLLLPVMLLVWSSATAQQAPAAATQPDASLQLSADQVDALNLLRRLARDLKSETDKIRAASLQARIADELWTYDESFARENFRWAFEAASQPIPDSIPPAGRAAYLTTQASAVKEVLRRFGAHDRKRAEAWLKSFEDSTKTPTSNLNDSRRELFMQIALQMASSNPEQALRLGVNSLSGLVVPNGFSSLLFALGNQDRRLSNELLRTGLSTLRRNNYLHDPSLIAMSNYLFSPSGELNSISSLSEAQLLAHYFVDAAWRHSGGDGTPLPPASASFYSLLETRAIPIVSRYVPDRLPELRGQMNRMASGLTPDQIQRTSLLRATQQQQTTVSNRNNFSIDEQLERALKEKDLRVRDVLFNSIAHGLMRSDTEKALAVTEKIDDANLRKSTEDDIYLVSIQQLLYSRSYHEARKRAAKLNNLVFRAKVLVQLASRLWSDNKDVGQSTELLAEATGAAVKSEDSPDKVIALLQAVEQFARFDSIRAFETLGTAITTLNRMNVEKERPHSNLSQPPLLRIKSYTVINGSEMTSGNDATMESIDFGQIKTLVIHDYMQTRLTANKIDQPLQRANFLTTVASCILTADRGLLTTSNN